jgi:hypothetical protein
MFRHRLSVCAGVKIGNHNSAHSESGQRSGQHLSALD